MIIRPSTLNDLPAIRALYDEAREYFRQAGIDQWQSGYPEDNVIEDDIGAGFSYVGIDDGGIVMAFVATTEPDENYAEIDGNWQSDEKYIAIHRVAVSNACKGKGYASRMIEYIENELLTDDVKYLRGDTHKDNKSMQRLLIKNGFKPAGGITLQSGSDKGAKRIAFDKIVK
ncbi:MAG: GNAT family N-acetyltransferase [Clostridia bacterium]|nr:GNAT family N-acetyltransferase [Clostridia bacterium]